MTHIMEKKVLLILKMGTTHPAVVDRCGDYDDWFLRAIAAHPRSPEILPRVVRPYREPLSPGPADALIVTGARESVYDPLPWIPAVIEFLHGVWRRHTPTLGVCFGHQLIARIFGGHVAKNPLGPTLGTAEVELTHHGKEDPLFQSFPSTFPSHETHFDAVVVPPPAARILARSPKDRCHALRISTHIWTVQFHPEMGSREMAAVLTLGTGIHAGRPPASSSAANPTDDVPGPTRMGRRLLERFLDVALF